MLFSGNKTLHAKSNTYMHISKPSTLPTACNAFISKHYIWRYGTSHTMVPNSGDITPMDFITQQFYSVQNELIFFHDGEQTQNALIYVFARQC